MKWDRHSVSDALLCFLIVLLLAISAGAAKIFTFIAVFLLIIIFIINFIINVLGIEPEKGTMGSDIIKRMNVMLWVMVIAAVIAEILYFII